MWSEPRSRPAVRCAISSIRARTVSRGFLPASVRTVVFLGLDGPYVQALYERIRELHPSVNRISELAYSTKAVTFVYVVPPSPLATSHRQSWLRDDNSSLAAKRREV